MCVRQAPEGVCVPRCIPISGAFPCWIAPIMVIGSDAVKGFVVIAHCAPTGDAPARCAATLYQEICGNRARLGSRSASAPFLCHRERNETKKKVESDPSVSKPGRPPTHTKELLDILGRARCTRGLAVRTTLFSHAVYV